MIKIENNKTHDFQEYNGLIFHRIKNDTKSYFRYSNTHMHVYVWETYMDTKVPKNYIIHHIDENTSNNDISNLVCMELSEHRKWHTNNQTYEMRKRYKKPVICIETGIEYESVTEAQLECHCNIGRGIKNGTWKYKEEQND